MPAARSATPKPMIDYIEQPSAAGSEYGFRVAAIVFGALVIPLAQLVLPRDEPVRWGWLAAALAGAAAGIATALWRRGADRRERAVTPPLISVFFSFMLVVAYLAFDLALTPGTGQLRWLLVAPPFFGAAIGNRAMFASIAVPALTGLAVTVVVAHQSGNLVSQVLTEVAIGVVILLLFRTFVEIAVRAYTRELKYGLMSEVAATVDSVQEGCERVLPIIGAYVGATSVMLVRVEPDRLTEISHWPDDAGLASADDATVALIRTGAAMELGEAAFITGSTEDGRGVGIARVATGDAEPLVLLTPGMDTGSVRGAHEEYALRQAALQLQMLMERVRLIQDLERLSRIDSLTGVANRRALMERLDSDTGRAARTAEPLSVVMIDLDHFKRYNDELGHLEGDRALVAIAELMTDRVRASDLVGRYGGEEFCIVLPQTGVGQAAALIEEMIAAGRTLALPRRLTFSAGVAAWDGAETIEALLDRADIALYRAKDAGRDRCCVAGDDPRSPTVDAAAIPPTSTPPLRPASR